MEIYHLMGTAPYYANSFLLVSEQKRAAIIDPAATPDDYATALRETGATLKLVLCTHGHMDHVGAAEALQKKYGAALYCAAEDILPRPNALYPLAGADHSFADGEALLLDELRFTVYRTPGHTPGSVCILCEGFFFTGDTLFHGGIGRTDLQNGSTRTMNESLRRLAALGLPADTQVLPGHNDFSTYGEEMAENYYIRMLRSEE